VYHDAEAGKPVSFATGAQLRLHTVSRHRDLESPNVAALLPGSDPALRAETVVFSAHLDHLGVGEAVDGDRIYNGAVDNASGVAALLAVAQALAAHPPRRSLLFLAVTGEEQGLLGSDYFARHAPAAAGTLVADVNMDSLGLLLPCADVVAVGGDSSTLGDTARRAAQRLGVEVSPDPTPEQALFVRSDQYSFVRRGVPSVFLNCGFKSREPGRDIGHEFEQWLRTVYHSPQDDMAHPLDLEAAARLTRLNLLVGEMVADEGPRPRWREGDFFGTTFGPAPAGAAARP
jgi:Zn-dependent M28 family amino/carboxypeptidase